MQVLLTLSSKTGFQLYDKEKHILTDKHLRACCLAFKEHG